jgi:electron transfer flavoprotein alpha subunit
VANVLVVIELCDGRALPVSLEALGQARRLSTRLGGTLYAVVPVERAPSYGEGDVIEVLARHGADKVVLVTDEALATGGPMRWGTHGPAIAQASELLPPLLMVFGLTPGAREVAPRAAARMGAAYVPDAWIEVRDDKLKLWEGSGADARSFADELDFPVVATVPPGRYLPAAGDEEAEVEVVPGPARGVDFDELGWEMDPRPQTLVMLPQAAATFDAAWETAPVTSGLDESAAALARVLGGEVRSPDEPAVARLVVSLGTPLEAARAEIKVAVGERAGSEPAHYALEGDAAAIAHDLARVLGEDAPAAVTPTGAESKA